MKKVLIDTNIAQSLAVDCIVTRNTQDFSSSSIAAVTPEQFIQSIAETED